MSELSEHTKMADKFDADGYEREVLGQCTTNPQPGSQHRQTVEAKYLWSYAQEEALIALSEKSKDGTWRLIEDPERRAKRIAARYADLYFKSAEKSRGKLQLYWPALAAFVVKDIVEAFRYAREEVLEGSWRTWDASKLGALALTGGSPYEHAIRVYVALAKGNLWLFEDIYPWLWFVIEYGLNPDGSLNEALLRSHVGQRNADQLQCQSKQALQELPFSANWLGRMKAQLDSDPVYKDASAIFNSPVVWSGPDAGYGAATAAQMRAHFHVRSQMPKQVSAYQIPKGGYWAKFSEAYYVLDETRRELKRVANDGGAAAALNKVAAFTVKPEIQNAYGIFIKEYAAGNKQSQFEFQKAELVQIARQEQLNVLQTLIYEDPKLKETMDANHKISRYTAGFLSPKYAVIYSAQPKIDDAQLKTVFDAPDGARDWATGPKKSLPAQADRMEYVGKIARDFNSLMETRRAYMDAELKKIQGWLNA